MTAATRNEMSPALDPMPLRLPLQGKLARRGHVAEQGRRGDDGPAREIALAALAHAVLPVAIERRDRALALLESVIALAEARSAPAHPAPLAHRAEPGA